MTTLSEEQWEELRQFGKKHAEEFSKIPEEFDRKMTRKLMQDPYAIPLMFEAMRRDIKENIKVLNDMEKMIPRLGVNDDLKNVFKLMCFFVKKEQEEQTSQWDYIEAVALNQIESRKDIARLIKATKKTKGNQKVVTALQNKIKKSDSDLEVFRKSKHYLEFTKRFWDERAGNKEND